MYTTYEYLDFDLDFFQAAIDMNLVSYDYQDILTLESCINLLVDNMVCLFIDNSSKEIQRFDWETNPFEQRYIQGDYTDKLFNFIKFVFDDKFPFPLNIIYSINWYDNFKNHGILNQLMFKLSRKMIHFPTIEKLIVDLKEIGTMIDRYIQSENDYYKLDYIVSNTTNNSGSGYFIFVKYYTLLEMLLFENDTPNDVKDQLVAEYLKKEFPNDALDVALLLRQMRNKIGHGNFKDYFKKAEQFATKYMQNFHFDYNEFSRYEWILTHSTFILVDTLRMVLKAELSNS